MIQAIGNLWNYKADIRIIFTNGYVKSNGACVMGRGCALQAAKRYPKLPYELGKYINSSGNHCYEFHQYKLITFPTKIQWMMKSSLDIINQSISELKLMIDTDLIYVMGYPGCGNGGLKQEIVLPSLQTLPNNIICIDYPQGK